ncbi:hypothetical protein [Microbulbifer sp. THAF38]|uniref:hypothetical protein n=1 Tax=Microbulbifer sp. THAF38 TaxID=2587856 RepID=UPI001267D5C6|nr:hypothetical protein [Microbulbifer sp. THAF38]QFT57149.1 hypothetical protein FIU95_21590 [Microbulbifer sp. THAF38]
MKKVKLSLFDILARLGSSAPTKVDLPPIDPTEGRVTQSVRFPPKVRQWINAHAEHLGVSVQDFISLTMKGVMETTSSPQTDELDTMVMRFFLLFESHGIATADIPNFLPPNSITRSELRDTNKIIDLMDGPVFEHLQKLFGIERDWLKGSSDCAYRSRQFYKNLPAILSEITRYKLKTGNSVNVLFLTRSGVELAELAKIKNEDCETNDYEYIHIVLKFEKRVGSQTIATYQLWDSLPWGYWRSRYHAKALIYFCDKTQNYTAAYSLSQEKLNDFICGRALFPGIERHGNRWLLDELAWDDDRNPERDELTAIKRYFKEQGGEPYLNAIRHPYPPKIKNYDAFLAGAEPLRIDESD